MEDSEETASEFREYSDMGTTVAYARLLVHQYVDRYQKARDLSDAYSAAALGVPSWWRLLLSPAVRKRWERERVLRKCRDRLSLRIRRHGHVSEEEFCKECKHLLGCVRNETTRLYGAIPKGRLLK